MTPRHDTSVVEPAHLQSRSTSTQQGFRSKSQPELRQESEQVKARQEAQDRLLPRISVRAPYFALRNIQELDGGVVSATVPPAPPSNPETGVAEAAQVARHLAILGSLAVAAKRDNDDRLHYLATKAHFLRTASEPYGEFDAADAAARAGGLRAEAVGQWIDKRNARAFVKLMSDDGQALNVLDVEYTVMAPRMFERLQPPIHASVLTAAEGVETPAKMPGLESLPFVVLPIPHDDRSRVTVDCGEIPVGMCAGHFPDYPAAPVALVMGQLAKAAGMSLNRQIGGGFDGAQVTYQVDEAKVKAARLGRAGQRLTLRTQYLRRAGSGHVISGVAEADGEVIGELEITLSVTSVPTPFPFPVGGF